MPRAATVLLVGAVVYAASACAEDSAPRQPPIEGVAVVVDGDGLDIGGRKIRLFGIDAPEVGQYCERPANDSRGGPAATKRWRCGQYATVALDRIAGGRRVRCEVEATDSYGRAVAICRLRDGTDPANDPATDPGIDQGIGRGIGPGIDLGIDLGAEQVRRGWAVAYRRYSERYVPLEDEARGMRIGVWSGTFEKPWDWRRRMR